jgi:ATP/maltotriose-dependent transcriptional regulator MalT
LPIFKTITFDLSQDYERDLALALARAGLSRAAVRLGDIDRALAADRAALEHAARLNIEAFALMALIPAAEIAAANGDLNQAARLAFLAAEHPHTFASDRAEAARLLTSLPPPPPTTLDLWAVVNDLIDL